MLISAMVLLMPSDHHGLHTTPHTDHHLEWLGSQSDQPKHVPAVSAQASPMVEHTGMYVMVTANSTHLPKTRCQVIKLSRLPTQDSLATEHQHCLF